MEQIRLIRDTSELEGTCYFEFLPGEYQEQCWNEGSVFLAEETFGLIEPIIARNEPQFDHYSFVCISRSTWERIIADLLHLVESLRSATAIDNLAGEIDFFFTTSAGEFAEDFRANADALAELARALVGWLREQLQQHECVSVLGM